MLQKPFDRSLWSDPWDARNVVGFVAGKGEKIDNLIRRNTKLCLDAGDVKSLIIHRVHECHMLVNELGKVFIAGGDKRLYTLRCRLLGERADYVIGLDTWNNQHG